MVLNGVKAGHLWLLIFEIRIEEKVCSGQHSEDWCPRGACMCSSQNSVFAADEEEEEWDMGGDEDEENQWLLSGDRNMCGIRKVMEKMCGRKRKRWKVVSSEVRLTAAKITVIRSQHNTSQRCLSWGKCQKQTEGKDAFNESKQLQHTEIRYGDTVLRHNAKLELDWPTVWSSPRPLVFWGPFLRLDCTVWSQNGLVPKDFF